MSGDRIARAMARIEAAASRIERGAPRTAISGLAPDPELARRYAALRSEAGRAMAEIDQLIETLKR